MQLRIRLAQGREAMHWTKKDELRLEQFRHWTFKEYPGKDSGDANANSLVLLESL
jgi:hypothetical protein